MQTDLAKTNEAIDIKFDRPLLIVHVLCSLAVTGRNMRFLLLCGFFGLALGKCTLSVPQEYLTVPTTHTVDLLPGKSSLQFQQEVAEPSSVCQQFKHDAARRVQKLSHPLRHECMVGSIDRLLCCRRRQLSSIPRLARLVVAVRLVARRQWKDESEGDARGPGWSVRSEHRRQSDARLP